MTILTFADQLAALRSVVFGAIDRWNAAHPQPLRSHQEHASVHVTLVYADETGVATYAIEVKCALAGTDNLMFHGRDLVTVVEHARLALERRIAAELQRRADKDHEDQIERNYGVAV